MYSSPNGSEMIKSQQNVFCHMTQNCGISDVINLIQSVPVCNNMIAGRRTICVRDDNSFRGRSVVLLRTYRGYCVPR